VVEFAVSGKFAAPGAHIERALLFTLQDQNELISSKIPYIKVN
jgi:hypothetical protein